MKTFARTDDLVLLQTGFVEGDLMARPNPDFATDSALKWPLTAHLSGQTYQVVNLPFQVSDRTLPYPLSVERKAAEHHRVWAIGTGKLVSEVVQTLVKEFDFRLRKQVAYGGVWVYVLEQRSDDRELPK